VHQNVKVVSQGGQCKAARAKTINIDTNILHQIGLQFDVDAKNQIKNWSSHLKNYKYGLLLKFGTPCILIWSFFDNMKIKQVTRGC